MKTAISSVKSNQQLLIRSLAITGAVVMPFFVHLVPPIMGIAAGAVLLPMFYLPLVASAWKIRSLVMLALFLPWLNMWITGMPDPLTTLVLTLEVGIFLLVAWHHESLSLPGLLAGPVGYIIAKAVATVFIALLVYAGIQQVDPLSYAIGIFTQSWPGLLILTLFSAGLFRHKG